MLYLLLSRDCISAGDRILTGDTTLSIEPSAEGMREEAMPLSQAPRAADIRSAVLARSDRSAHRRYTWLYEDLLS